MAVPTITVISPAVGPVGGRRLVQVMGGGFQLPPLPPPTGPAPAPPPTVEVLFGSGSGVLASPNVAVASDARLLVVTPASPLGHAAPAGKVDVTVRNIDQDGDPLPGESLTLPLAYEYALPDLNAVPERDLTRLVRALIRELRRQVLPGGVHLTVHTDWSDDPASGLAAIAAIPALVLSGPSLRENRFYSINKAREVVNPFGLGAAFYAELRPPYTIDLVFDVIGATDSQAQHLNLMAEVVDFFHRNQTLSMANSSTDPAAGATSWELDWEPGSQPKAISVPNSSSIRAFRGTFVLRGFDLDETDVAAGIVKTVEDQVGGSSVAAPSAVILGGPADPRDTSKNAGTGIEQLGE